MILASSLSSVKSVGVAIILAFPSDSSARTSTPRFVTSPTPGTFMVPFITPTFRPELAVDGFTNKDSRFPPPVEKLVPPKNCLLDSLNPSRN